MIKTNCELPLTLLSKNLDLNEMDLVLFHLFIENEEYKNYYLSLRKEHPERTMILDNSGYEFWVRGEVLDLKKYSEVIKELRPDYYILPDTLMDCNKTLIDAGNLLKEYNFESSKPMAVIQGNSEIEMVYCLMKFLQMNVQSIAVPFHNTFFKHMRIDMDIIEKFLKEYSTINEDILYAMGRVQFVRNITKELEDVDYIHLLGSHCPYEKVFYTNYNSMDTGYPVKCAICGVNLGKETSKPNNIIDDFFTEDLDEVTKILIELNVNKFKNYK